MPIAFVFPGQGSQTIGMLGTIADENPVYGDIVNATFNRASNVLGYDLWELLQNGSAAELNRTKKTQPAILTASYALWQIWISKQGVKPVILAGHSLGEYTALVCAEAMDFEDVISLVSMRGQYMQESVAGNEGTMAAIFGLEDDEVIRICEEIAASSGSVVSVVNFNAPGQVVIAGNAEAVESAGNELINAGAKKAVKLPVSVPAHCSLMESAAEKLAKKLHSTEFNRPIIPVINNVHVTIENDVEAIKEALVKQLYSPVKWSAIINKMLDEGTEHIVECGSGKILTGLNRRINKNISAHSIFDTATIDKVFEELS